MLGLVAGVIRQLAEAGGSVFGIRHGVEEPRYDAQSLAPDVEIRHYGSRIAAETVIAGSEESARNNGFRRLARYIFGANRGKAKIAMTAPVAQEASTRGEKIAMTAPVSQTAFEERWVIRFFMPAKKTLESLPGPDDPEVRLVTVPAETIAVIRFSGRASHRALTSQTDRLIRALQENGLQAIGTLAAWFYDPPWTVPMLRRNEIAVPVVPTASNDEPAVSQG